MASFSFSEPAVQSYAFYSGILGLKMLGMTLLTVRERKKIVIANEEDARKRKYLDIERVRRAHLNDLENIPVFWVVGALYLTTGPSASCTTNLFRVYAAGRVLHTLVYAVKPLPPPARAISFGVPFLITIYMGVKVIRHYCGAM